MIATAGSRMSSVLRKPSPEFRAGASLQRVRTDAHDARSKSGMATIFTRLAEEIDASLRPTHPAIAFREPPRTAEMMLKAVQQVAKVFQIMCTSFDHSRFLCHGP